MDQEPLVREQIDAGARFVSEFQKQYPVQVAFWLTESNDSERSLYVVSDQITDDNFDVAYGEVARIAGALQDPWFDPFQVKLIGIDDPLAKAVADMQRRSLGRVLTRFNGKVLGGVPVDEIDIYPSPIPARAQ